MAVHYNPNDYGLKYFHRHTDINGMEVMLEIYKRGEVGYPIYMGDFTSLNLHIQGSQDEVDAPIVKTSLTFSLVDSYDKGMTDIEGVVTKYGNWSEFFTPDSTLYLVRVLTKALGETAFSERWSGYITPDSWEESLDYYGEVSITARDNIGHLADFEFDAAGDDMGLISLRDIFGAAFDKIALPMDSVIMDSAEDDHAILEQGGIAIFDMLLNIEAFKGKNWLQVVESVLTSYGLVMRYADNNKVIVDTIRNISLVGNNSYDAVESKELEFLNGSRMLIPAYKKIVSTLKYDVEDAVNYPITKRLSFNEGVMTAPFSIRMNYQGGHTDIYGTSQFDTNIPHTAEGMTGYGLFMNHNKSGRILTDSAIREGVDKDNVVFVGINITDSVDRYIRYEFGNVNSLDCIFRMNFHSRMFEMYPFANEQRILSFKAYLKSFSYSLIYKNPDGSTIYYDELGKRWSHTMVLNEHTVQDTYSDVWEVDLEKAEGKGNITANGGNLYVIIKNIQAVGDDTMITFPSGTGIYLGIRGFELAVSGSTNLDSDTVTTINDERMNVTISSSPDLGVISRVVNWQSVKNYLNVLYKKIDGIVSMTDYNFVWSDSEGSTPMGAYPEITADGTDFPLPMLIHLQKLLWHGSITSILEGDCIIKDCNPISLSRLYEYKGVPFYLASGTIDFIHARVNGAIFVEATNAIPKVIKVLASEEGTYITTEDGKLVNVIVRYK